MERLIHYCRDKLKINLTNIQIDAFDRYREELIMWNQKMNLTSISAPEDIEIKHFIDSLTCLLAMDISRPITLIDVGTGAGFPGIPLKIICPAIKLTLVESVGKKAEFCQRMVTHLDLKQTIVLSNRIEDIGHDPNHREDYDYALARAVASLPTLVEYLLPLVKVNGHVIAQKGKNYKDELDDAQKAIDVLGGETETTISLQLPFLNEDRNLVVLRKTHPTMSKYPRRPGIPSKKPLI
jgi:16S rRNA (guanine527-N7)-methyltransferase